MTAYQDTVPFFVPLSNAPKHSAGLTTETRVLMRAAQLAIDYYRDKEPRLIVAVQTTRIERISHMALLSRGCATNAQIFRLGCDAIRGSRGLSSGQ